MNYLVAVSGGVDSVVLLDMLSKTDHRLVIAHVDHGIRGEESAADARFVEVLAKRYKLPFVKTELHLDTHASEETARNRRYEFLFAQAKKFHATVVTAHHRDDMVETIALNFERGTRWRGLAVLDRADIRRPLLAMSKAMLYEYAVRNHLEWVDDATNHTDVYQRNRIRAKLAGARIDSGALAELRARQLQLKRDIDRETARLLVKFSHSRHVFTQIEPEVAYELLGAWCIANGLVRPTRPRLERFLVAIKTAKPGSAIEVGDGVKVSFTSRTFVIKAV